MLENKTAIITGSNRGIGKAALKIFLENNAKVWACCRKMDNQFYDDISEEYKKNIRFLSFDFEDSNQVKEAANKIIKETDKIDILINNAGIIDTSMFLMTKIESIKNTFNINFFSQLEFTQIIIKKMIKAKSGNIINVSSISATDPVEGRLSYSSSKAAFVIASKILSKELSKFNIRVNIIAPGLTKTSMMKNNHTQENIDKTIQNIALNRVAEPEEVANVLLFLSSNLSSYINGQVIRIDGGIF